MDRSFILPQQPPEPTVLFISEQDEEVRIDKLLSEETGLPVHVADDPTAAVVKGTGKVLDELRYLEDVTVPIKAETYA